MQKLLISALAIFFVASCQSNSGNSDEEKNTPNVIHVDFWNGNRSEIRQKYELEVLEAILSTTATDFGPYEIKESLEEYPGAEEALVFSEKKHHLFVTIAGNKKFTEEDMIVVDKPLAKNLLGYRIPIIRSEDAAAFSGMQKEAAIKALTTGIPVTWSDATIFRHNGYQVSEEGDFNDIFERLASGRFDYTAFGANEVQSIFKNRAAQFNTLTIEVNHILFYPFPLVFYINPNMPELAKRIDIGLQDIIDSGQLDTIFKSYYGNLVESLNLNQRRLFELENPLIPDAFSDLKPDLSGL